MKKYPCCPHCRHLPTDHPTGHDLPCTDRACASQMRETVEQSVCPNRGNHATELTHVMRAMRLELRRCPCGLRYATPITAERN